MKKYITLVIFPLVIFQSCIGQEKGRNKKDKVEEIQIIDRHNTICGKNSSSQNDYSHIKDWKLSNEDIRYIFKTSEKINGHILHYAYGNLACEISGKVKIKGKVKGFTINAGGYYFLDNEIYGCNSPECYKYFPKEAQENDDAYDTENGVNTIDNASSPINDRWLATYSASIDYGKLDEFSEMQIDYDINITKDSCTFSGLGYKTFFTDLCRVIENKNTLILKFIKSIDSDGFSNHSNIDTLGVIIMRNNKYYFKSKIVADKNWNYNTEISIKKQNNK